MNGGKNFLDTNIFVYAQDADSPAKQGIARQLILDAIENGTGYISLQILREFANVALNKFKHAISEEALLKTFDKTMLPLLALCDEVEITRKGIAIQRRTGYSYYDSLVIAAAIETGCTILYSEDMQDSQQIDGLVIVNPFK